MDQIKRLYGVYRGVVKNNNDPQKQRRIKVTVQTTGTETTDWAWPMEAAGVSTAVPVMGQGVWVQYIGGDPEYPVWFGEFGKHQGKNKKLYLKPLDNSVSLTDISSYLVITTLPDGTKELDLVASLVAMANKLKDHEARIHTLETTPDIDH
jgi:hypothetical protein